MNLTEIQTKLLEEVADIHKIPQGAFSIRINGQTALSNSTKEIAITPQKNKQGFVVKVKSGTKHKSLHIPAIIADSSITEEVFNDFYIGDNSEVLIVAGCGIHNDAQPGQHSGVHTFFVGKNCKVKYTEKHLGLGNQSAQKIISPTTKIVLDENSTFEVETTQLGGVSLASRNTTAEISANSTLIVKEKLLTEGFEAASSNFLVDLKGKNSHTEIVSRAIAKNKSQQNFASTLLGNNQCFGRVECDGIILDSAKISSCPAVQANHNLASLSHEAQIGKIANEQLLKLMSLGLTQSQAEEKIIQGYLLMQ